MYAYCTNNPVNSIDPSGHEPQASTIYACIAIAGLVIAAVATCGAATPIAVVGISTIVAAAGLGVAAGAAAAGIVSAVIENTTPKNNFSNNSVYVMRNSSSKRVEYVGRTNNPERRKKEHARDPSKAGLLPVEVVSTGMTKRQARSTEQVLISAYALDNLKNARREIATGNVSGFAGNMDSTIKLFGSISEDELLNLMGR